MEEKKVLVKITHITNPSRFYFRELDNDNLKLAEKVKKIETEIEEYLTDEDKNFFAGTEYFYQPKKNEIVAFYDVINSKWIRCVVDEIFKYDYDPTVILWSIDYGFPFQVITPDSKVLPIPEKFRFIDNFIQQGSLNVIPCEHRFNIQDKKTIYCKDWKMFPVEAFHAAVEDYNVIHWKPTKKKFGDTVLGDLLFGRRERSLIEALTKEGFGKTPEDINDFCKKYKQLEVNGLSRYNDHQRSGGIFKHEYGIPSYCKLIIKHESQLKDEPEKLSNFSLDHEEKVENWLIRCNNDDSLNETLDDEFIEENSLEETVSDIDNLSSVSQPRPRRNHDIYL